MQTRGGPCSGCPDAPPTLGRESTEPLFLEPIIRSAHPLHTGVRLFFLAASTPSGDSRTRTKNLPAHPPPHHTRACPTLAHLGDGWQKWVYYIAHRTPRRAMGTQKGVPFEVCTHLVRVPQLSAGDGEGDAAGHEAGSYTHREHQKELGPELVPVAQALVLLHQPHALADAHAPHLSTVERRVGVID
jgi:hypothetical protein